MSYTALYRKYRPGEFEHVKGQDHIVTTLKNQIAAERIGHAYLFCGTRGTGKTTIAKLFAKAVNCEHPVDGSPCGQCASCKAIASGASMNVIEIDAASNNGVDNIRDIREQVEYSPTQGKYKVYIIDEVHMLSIGAFNALLKTLEEPPSYVIFILATTEAHKIPITILSRCQRYDFRRITIDTITDRMRELMEQEKIEVEERALRYIAKAADGSMRDALSLLDQCIAFFLGQKLTYENVLEVLGAVDTEVFGHLLRNIAAGDVNGCVRVLEDLVIQGRELGQFVTDFIWYLRNLLLAKSSAQMEDVLDMSAENLAVLKEEAALVDSEVFMRYIRVFSELANQIRYASQKRVLIEIALIKLCKPAMEESVDSLYDRVERLERQLAEGVVVPAGTAGSNAAGYDGGKAGAGGAKAAGGSGNLSEGRKPQLPKALTEDIRQVVKNWNSIRADLPDNIMRTYLKPAHLSLAGDDRLMVVLEDEMAASYITEEKRQELVRHVSDRIGKEIDILIQTNESGRPFDESYVDLEKLQDLLGMEIEVEDE